MVHPDVVIKANASKDDDSKHSQLGVVHIDVRIFFTNKHEFTLREHIIHWIRMELVKLGFNIDI